MSNKGVRAALKVEGRRKVFAYVVEHNGYDASVVLADAINTQKLTGNHPQGDPDVVIDGEKLWRHAGKFDIVYYIQTLHMDVPQFDRHLLSLNYEGTTLVGGNDYSRFLLDLKTQIFANTMMKLPRLLQTNVPLEYVQDILTFFWAGDPEENIYLTAEGIWCGGYQAW